jgi:diketogulonate reductase-like aldo/keto reductase
MDLESVELRGGGAIPTIGLGTWELRGKEARRVTETALGLGYRHIDTATMYRNEAEVGQAIVAAGVPRNAIFVTTKLSPDDVGRERVTIESSLEALALDHVDLWLIHWPPDGRASPKVWEQLLAAREAGFTTHVGVSNYSIEQIDELVTATGEGPSVNQVPWAPSLHDAAVADAHRARDVVLEGYSPLKRSDLDGPALASIATAHGVTAAQVILRWHVQHRIVAIPKSANAGRLAENLDVFAFVLTDTEMATLDALA